MGKNLTNKGIKDLYNKAIKEKYQNDYEFRRWFLSARLRLDFFMTRTAITHHLKKFDYDVCLEFGPGSGIFTTLIYRRNSRAEFDLMDISEEMKNQFKLEMRQQPNVNYIVDDFIKYDFNKKYDFFFSVRSIEYIEDKEIFFRKLDKVIKSNGSGIIITKNPHYGIKKSGWHKRWQHSGKITVEDMKTKLIEHGFEQIKIYPVIIRLPIIERFFIGLSEIVFNKVFTKPITDKILPYTESYLVAFSRNSFNKDNGANKDKNIVEFVGLSGAGKSYVADKVSLEKKIDFLNEINISKKFELLQFITHHPFFFIRLILKLIKENIHNLKLLKHKLINIFLPMLARIQFAEAQKDIIVEFGIFQFLLSLYEKKIDLRELKWIKKYLNNKKYFIYLVEANRETRLERMRRRGRVPRQGLMPEEDLKKWLDILEHNYIVIKEFIKSNFKYEIVENN